MATYYKISFTYEEIVEGPEDGLDQESMDVYVGQKLIEGELNVKIEEYPGNG